MSSSTDFILREKDLVYADMEIQLKYCRERCPEDENLSDLKMKRIICSIDKGRTRYYNYFSLADRLQGLGF